MPEDIFGTTPNEVRADDLIGEGKKFKDVDALARGKTEADAFIERLKAEKAESDRKVQAAANAEAELAALREELAQMRKQEPPKVDRQVQPPSPEKDIEAIVEETITRAEARRTAAQNVQEANRVMTSHFGDPQKAGAEVAKRANELGLTMDDLKGIAARSPSAFKRLMIGDLPVQGDIDLGRSTVAPPPAVRTEPGTPGTKEFYQKLLRENPRRYADPAVQAEILKATIAGTYIP